MIRYLIVCALFSAAIVSAQTGVASIQGTVKDATSAVIPGAAVLLEHVQTANRLRTTTNEAGFYVFPGVQPGDYRLRVELAGMEPWQGQLLLQVGQQVVVDPVLKVGATSTEVTVAGDVTPLLTTTSATLSNIVERARIEQLPLNGRFFNDLMQLTTPGLEGSSNRSRAYGLRDGSMEYLQDGVALNDRNTGRMINRPPGLDTIQEFRVETGVSSARYGSPTSAILSTRAGTNQLHGTAFYTGRNNGFGIARRREDFYAKAPQLIRNEYGASLGGPVLLPRLYNGRNRSFFFASWEDYKLRTSTTNAAALTPDAMRAGDFSGLVDSVGRAYTLYDPWSTTGATWRRVPYPGNQIPAALRSPLAAYVYSVTPLPTLPGVNPMVSNNYFAPDPSKTDHRTYTFRGDHRWRDQDLLFGRVSGSWKNEIGRRAYDTVGNPVTTDRRWNAQSAPEVANNAMLSWTHIFSPRLFVETVATGFNANWNVNFDLPVSTENVAALLKLPNPFNRTGPPQFADTGFGPLYSGWGRRSQNTRTVTGEQNYTYVRGSHEFQFGWRYRNQALDTIPDQPPQSTLGFYSYATSLYDPATAAAMGAMPQTGHPAANFYLGISGYYTAQKTTEIYDMRSKNTSGYVQDNWKVSPRLTVNLGMRYEYMTPYLDLNGVSGVFDVASKAIARPASIDDLIRRGLTTRPIVKAYEDIGVRFTTTREVGLPDGLIHTNKRDFAPRAGFAYNWSAGGRNFVLRGGYGVYRFPLPARTYNLQNEDPPLKGTYVYNQLNASTSTDGLPNYTLRSTPSVIAGSNSANLLSADQPLTVSRGVTVVTLDSAQPNSLAHEFNLTLQADIGARTVVRAGYVGTAGRHLEQLHLINSRYSTPYVWYVTTGLPLPSGTYASVTGRALDQTTYGDIAVYSKRGFSNFNGLQLELQRNFHQGIAFQFFYVMSNAFSTGSIASDGGNETANSISQPNAYLPGAVPEDLDERIRFLRYQRDAEIPKHRIRWNFLVDFPMGRGKPLLGNAGPWLNRLAGGWQLAAYSSMQSRFWALPTANWGTLGEIQVYGTQYKVSDCRSGRCIDGHLYYNGYIPANRINSTSAQGQPNGVMGVPQNYRPAHQPLYPIPADGGSVADPNYRYYETNNVLVPLKSGAQQLVALNTGLHPWQNQVRVGPWIFDTNASLFKAIPVTERLVLRLNMDFFNLLNMPGLPMPNSSTGIISLQNSVLAPRQLQWSARLTW